jgi:hypothetical protein
MELCLGIAAIFAGGRPGTLDQGGLEPGGVPPAPRGDRRGRGASLSAPCGERSKTTADVTRFDGANIAAALR